MSHWFFLVLLGLVVGVASGLFGIGGGVVLIPALILLFGYSAHETVGISLCVAVFAALSGAVWHYFMGGLNFRPVPLIVIGAIGGAYLGTLLHTHVSGELLRRLFGVILILVGLNLYFEWTGRLMQTDKTADETPNS